MKSVPAMKVSITTATGANMVAKDFVFWEMNSAIYFLLFLFDLFKNKSIIGLVLGLNWTGHMIFKLAVRQRTSGASKNRFWPDENGTIFLMSELCYFGTF